MSDFCKRYVVRTLDGRNDDISNDAGRRIVTEHYRSVRSTSLRDVAACYGSFSPLVAEEARGSQFRRRHRIPRGYARHFRSPEGC